MFNCQKELCVRAAIPLSTSSEERCKLSSACSRWRPGRQRVLSCVSSAVLTGDIDIAILSVRPSAVRPSVRQSHSGTLSKRLNILYFPQHHSYRSSSQRTKHICKIPTGSPMRGRRIQVGYINFAIFDQHLATVYV